MHDRETLKRASRRRWGTSTPTDVVTMRRQMTCALLLPPACVLLAVAAPPLLAARLLADSRAVPVRIRSAARMAAVLGAYLATFEIPALALGLRDRARKRNGPAEDCVDCVGRYRRLLGLFFGAGLTAAGMRARREPASVPVPAGRPVVLLVRHAGLLNTQLMGHTAYALGRRPHILCKAAVCTDLGHGLLLRHLAGVIFRSTRAGRAVVRARIAEAAGRLRAGEALIIAPEGTNFTAARRAQAIRSLRRQGHGAEADLAAGRRHVLPPHLAGVDIALDAAPEVDVVFFAHTGLESLTAWCAPLGYPVPPDDTLDMAWWRVPAEEVPTGTAAREAWLLDWWGRIDRWVAGHVEGREPVPAAERREPVPVG